MYLGVDYHKSFSYFAILDEKGKVALQTKILNEEKAVASLCQKYRPEAAVMEASRNWEVMYDLLERFVDRVVLAHPLKVKAIASAKIKTDKVDATILAHLLRADLLPTAHVPKVDTREARAILRQRMFFVRTQTAVKNRITTLVDKYQLVTPTKGLFTKTTKEWLAREAPLSKTDKKILAQELALLNELETRISQSNSLIAELAEGNEDVARLRSIPGLGPFFSVLVNFEIDGIKRFPSAKKLHAYAGLVPSTYQSGNSIRHGKLTKQGNKWLRYAMVEAVYPAIRRDPSLRAFYQKLKKRKGANPAKVATARRLLTIVFKVLKDKRMFEVRLS